MSLFFEWMGLLMGTDGTNDSLFISKLYQLIKGDFTKFQMECVSEGFLRVS